MATKVDNDLLIDGQPTGCLEWNPGLLQCRLMERENLTRDEFLTCELSLSWFSDHALLPSESSHFSIRCCNRACNEIHEMASQD